jgi:hypothetical protein
MGLLQHALSADAVFIRILPFPSVILLLTVMERVAKDNSRFELLLQGEREQ